MDLFGNLTPAPRTPVVVALEEERGRVAVIGFGTWLRPDELQMGDNKRFLLNTFRYLARTKP